MGGIDGVWVFCSVLVCFSCFFTKSCTCLPVLYLVSCVGRQEGWWVGLHVFSFIFLCLMIDCFPQSNHHDLMNLFQGYVPMSTVTFHKWQASSRHVVWWYTVGPLGPGSKDSISWLDCRRLLRYHINAFKSLSLNACRPPTPVLHLNHSQGHACHVSNGAGTSCMIQNTPFQEDSILSFDVV